MVFPVLVPEAHIYIYIISWFEEGSFQLMIFTCNVYLGHVSTRFTNHYQLDMDDTKNHIMLGISILKRKFLK